MNSVVSGYSKDSSAQLSKATVMHIWDRDTSVQSDVADMWSDHAALMADERITGLFPRRFSTLKINDIAEIGYRGEQGMTFYQTGVLMVMPKINWVQVGEVPKD